MDDMKCHKLLDRVWCPSHDHDHGVGEEMYDAAILLVLLRVTLGCTIGNIALHLFMSFMFLSPNSTVRQY